MSVNTLQRLKYLLQFNEFIKIHEFSKKLFCWKFLHIDKIALKDIIYKTFEYFLNKFFIIKNKFLSIEKTVKNVLMQILTYSYVQNCNLCF